MTSYYQGGGTLLILGPVSMRVLTGKKRVDGPPKVLPDSTTVLTGKKKGGWSPPQSYQLLPWY